MSNSSQELEQFIKTMHSEQEKMKNLEPNYRLMKTDIEREEHELSAKELEVTKLRTDLDKKKSHFTTVKTEYETLKNHESSNNARLADLTKKAKEEQAHAKKK